MFLLVLSITTSLKAQKFGPWWQGVGFEANYFHSDMLRHTSNITAALAENTASFELSIVKKYHGQKDWEIRRNYPEGGVGLIFVNYRKNDLYGKVFGIFPHLRLRLLTLKNFSWSVRVAMGVGYVTKPYERVPDPNLENATIGSKWNNISPLQTDLRYRLNDHLEFQGGIHLLHVSNAAFRKPNLGINIWGIQAGLRYFPISNNPERIEREVPRLRNRFVFYGKGSIAFIEKYMPDGGLHRIYNGGLFTTYRYRGTNKIIFGVDYTFNTALYAEMKYNERNVGEEAKHSYQITTFAGHEFLFKNFGLVMQVGAYLKQMDIHYDKFYQKLGGNFYVMQREEGFIKEMLFSAYLKTHLNKAELFELGFSLGI